MQNICLSMVVKSGMHGRDVDWFQNMSVIFFFVTFFAMVEQVLFKRSSILILCFLVKRGTGWFMQPEALHGIGRSNFFPA